jgi:hypothetical protein
VSVYVEAEIDVTLSSKSFLAHSTDAVMPKPYARTLVPVVVTLIGLVLIAGIVYIRSRPPAHLSHSQSTPETTETDQLDAPEAEPIDPSEQDPNRPIFATPRDCFDAYRTALAAGDVAAQLASLAPWDRYQRVGWYAYYLDREIFYERENAKAARELLAAHDVVVGRVMDYIHTFKNAPTDEVANLVSRIGENIINPIDFAVAAAKLVTIDMLGADPLGAANVELAGLDKQDAIAIGNVRNPETGSTEKIVFKRIAGSWLITTNP